MVNNKDCFNEILAALNSVVIPSIDLPQLIFQENYRRFRFFEFDRTLSEYFWEVLQKIADQSNDSYLNVVSIDPDPVEYFYEEFSSFGAVQISVSASADEYYDALNDHPPSFRLDSLFHSDSLTWFPPSARWLIWGVRDYGIAVLAMQDGFAPSVESIASEAGMPILTLDEALSDIVSLNFRNPIDFELFSKELKTNYPSYP